MSNKPPNGDTEQAIRYEPGAQARDVGWRCEFGSGDIQMVVKAKKESVDQERGSPRTAS